MLCYEVHCQVRDDEEVELARYKRAARFKLPGKIDEVSTKVGLLIQMWLDR